MKFRSILICVLFAGSIQLGLCVEPISGAYAVGAAVLSLGAASFNFIYCRFSECCDRRWLINNVTGLEEELTSRLYGQHLVKKAVTNHIKGHVKTQYSPAKALVLSFHGPTGTGKNHVSRIIAEHLYKEGLKSKHVHLISATKEFPHEQMVPLYKDHLRHMIEQEVKKCPRSLFIIDEVDKMPKGLLDTIKPYLDYHEELGGIDYRQTIFLFLSNAGGRAITEYALQRWKEGMKREDISLLEMEKILAKAAINSESEGGLWHSELISKHLVTAFLPFLPLERKDVRRCVRDVLTMKGYFPSGKVPQEVMDKVIAELAFYPENEQLYSVTGCKRVAEKVDYVMFD